MNRFYNTLWCSDNYLVSNFRVLSKLYIFLILIFLILFTSCTSIESEEESETLVQENLIEDTLSEEGDPFENLPCVIRCNLTPTPLDEGNVSVELQCNDCDIINVLRVIDGDTVETEDGVVRFYGIDTPENGEKCFYESTEKTKNLIFRDMEEPFIGSLRVEKSVRLKDNFGRLLFYVYTLDGDSIGEILIKEGLAKAWTKDGHHLEHFLELQSLYSIQDSICF